MAGGGGRDCYRDLSGGDEANSGVGDGDRGGDDEGVMRRV